MEALKHNILFRGYYKKKAKKEEQERIEGLEQGAP
jgi:hypothetical protein